MSSILTKCIVFFALVFSCIACGTAAPPDSDEKSQIYVYVHTEDESKSVIAVDPETGDWTNVMSEGRYVRLSPDGKKIAFRRDGRIGICPIANTSGIKWVLKSDGRPIWAPDGSQVLSSNSLGRNATGPRFETLRATLDGENQEGDTGIPETEQVFDWSPDGKWVATASRRDQPEGMGWQLYVMHPDGSEARHLTRWGVNYHAQFSPDGKQIAYVDNSRSMERIKVVDVAGGEARKVFQAPKELRLDALSWSPDGKQLVISASNWHVKEDGRRIFPGPRPFDPNYHLLLIDVDGAKTKELQIKNIEEIIFLGEPDWR